jgi:hypothetical protein
MKTNSLLTIILAAALLALAACSTTAPEPSESDMSLDLETLTAETELGTLQAQRADNSYVGLIEEGRAIGIAFLAEVTAADGPALEDEIVIYLYDRQELAMMMGDIDAEGAATLASEEVSDFEAIVELTVEGDIVSGTVTFPGEQPTSFTANAAASAGGGVFWAEGNADNTDGRCDWIVLPDGRQWGCICFPPTYNNPCCLIGF